MSDRKYRAKTIIGWREWCALPDLKLPGVVAKIDTGAKTSCLHAFRIKNFVRDGEEWLRFYVHPIQRHRHPEILCEARLADERTVTSSNGKAENRPVISTRFKMGKHTFATELTLTNRDEMGFRMLIGRRALARRFIVDSTLSHALGGPKEDNLYP